MNSDMIFKLIRKDNYLALSSLDDQGKKTGIAIEEFNKSKLWIGEFSSDSLIGYGAFFNNDNQECYVNHVGKYIEKKRQGICVTYAKRYKTSYVEFGYYYDDKFETGFRIDQNGVISFISKSHKDFKIDYTVDKSNNGVFKLFNDVRKVYEEESSIINFATKQTKVKRIYKHHFGELLNIGKVDCDNGFIYNGEIKNNKPDGIGIRYNNCEEFQVMMKDTDGVVSCPMKKINGEVIYDIGSFGLKLFSNEPTKAELAFKNYIFCIDGTNIFALFNKPNELGSKGFTKKKPYYCISFNKDYRILIDEMLNDEIVKCSVFSVKFNNVIPEKNDTFVHDKEAEKALEGMIGLDNVKKKINRIKAYAIKSKGQKVNLHMAFLGNPGTGKTVVAKLINDIFYKNKILPTAKLINTDRSGLVGAHTGETAIKTKKIIEEAQGGVLFIDEAYSLYSDSSRDFGNEAITELLKQMEDKKGEFCCILAGYKKDMHKLFNMNPGFKSRIQYIIDFEDFSLPELKEIAKQQIEKNNLKVSDEILAKLLSILKFQKENLPNFGNARDVRNLIEQIGMIATDRVDYDGTVKMEDIAIYMKENTLSEKRIAKVKNISYEDLQKFYSTEYIDKPYEECKVDLYESIIQIVNNYDQKSVRKSGFVISPNGYAITVDLNSNECLNANAVRHIFDRFGNRINVSSSVSVAAEWKGISIIKLSNDDDYYSFVPVFGNISIDSYIGKNAIVIGTIINENRVSIIEEYKESKVKIIKKNLDASFEFEYSENIDYMDGSAIIDPDTGKILGIIRGKNRAESIDKICALLKAVGKRK